ncbi:MFS transporter [Nocardioides sp. SOB77]|uniref:MFS transporter n=1 Tax=Nocardioides oceani TaxID=3058369 RepID=A0ABT8FKQ7_9ACTN|nr:MFS transporter [Nocardioides oceani]MDN4174962.1 MFS transporter [Nocardioides oceani]
MPPTRARAAAAAAFATQGLVFISLTTRLPDFSDRWGLSEVALSMLLLVLVLAAGVGSVVAERVAARHDSARLLRAGLLVMALALPTLVLAGDRAVFVAGIVGYGFALGLVDAATNMQAVAVEHRYGRPLLPSLHGCWTLGGLVGAATTLATATLPLGVTAALAVVPLLAAAAPYLPRVHAPPDPDVVLEAAAVPWRPIALVGAAMVVFYMVDSASAAWGPLYLDDVVSAPERLVALATFPYLLASLVVRLAGDRLVATYGAVPVLRVGAVVAALALAVVVLAPTWPVAVAGFTLLGAGVAVIAPLSFSAAARIAGGDQARVDAVVARFNQFNYVGGLLGSVLTGLAGAGSLRLGFAVPMVLVLALLPLARTFAAVSAPPPSAAGPASSPAGAAPRRRSRPAR